MTDIHHSTRNLCLNSEHDLDAICVLDGAGSVFQVNFFAPIMLVNGLLGELKAAVPSGGGRFLSSPLPFCSSCAARFARSPQAALAPQVLDQTEMANRGYTPATVVAPF